MALLDALESPLAAIRITAGMFLSAQVAELTTCGNVGDRI